MTLEYTLIDYKNLLYPLLDESLSMEEVSVLLRKLHLLFSEGTGITGKQKGKGNERLTQLDTAAGISTNGAARCLWAREDIRTISFFRSLNKAIEKIKNEKPNKVVQILYAGCGPYATFLSMVAPLYEAEEIQFSLIEVNEVSYKVASQFIEDIGLKKYVSNFALADAIQYQIERDTDFDILVSETLDRGLKREPLVPILLNLLPQLPEDVIVLPQNVFLDFALVKKQDLPSNAASDLRNPSLDIEMWKEENVFDIQSALVHFKNGEMVGHLFPSQYLNLPNIDEYDFVVIYTRVQVYEDCWMGLVESDFTEPLLTELKEEEKDKSKVELSYCIKPLPELQYTFK